jgi:hypothetical protein
MATKRISSHLILHRYVLIINQTYLHLSWCSHECVSNFFHNIYHTHLHKKEEYRHLHGAVREYVISLKEKPQVSISHLDQLLMTLCSFFFWIGPRLNHYQYHLIWEPDATEHPLFLIVNCHHNTMVCFSLNFQKSKWNLHQMSKILNSLIWYFDFWKLMDEGNLLNLKILNPILSKILKLIVESFQNYFYKIKVSKLKWK